MNPPNLQSIRKNDFNNTNNNLATYGQKNTI